jgi:5-methylcytosine-specific restriction endonuclease McrA
VSKRVHYSRFLRSPYWRALRRQVLTLVPRCERCDGADRLQVHHTTYDYLGTKTEYYELRGLEVLCEWCHAAHHGLPVPPRPIGVLEQMIGDAGMARLRAIA